LRACDRIQPANTLNLGVSQLWEADDGTILEESGRNAKILGYFIALDFWKNSLYSSRIDAPYVNLNIAV
jgi:hypothetical protein